MRAVRAEIITGGRDYFGAFTEQRQIVRDCDVTIRGNADTVFDALKGIFRSLLSRGVLDSTSIKSLIQAGTLLHDADAKNSQSASYDLRVGKSVWCKGVISRVEITHLFAGSKSPAPEARLS